MCTTHIGRLRPADHPAPNWVAQSPSGRAHLGWWLGPNHICRTDSARLTPIRYAHRIETGLKLCVGGDCSYGGQLTKNPIHPDCRRRPGARPDGRQARRRPITVARLMTTVVLPVLSTTTPGRWLAPLSPVNGNTVCLRLVELDQLSGRSLPRSRAALDEAVS
ncbi:replication initiation protein [Rhodococcus marinonascens]|uniref:replication initiation protein n=1 Tax=Rhodococcus marinonascens TaxID=38311 RepID=UPI001FEC3FB4|nr:replication initiation protein [Rhodococcus marinonascens]